MLSFSKTNMKGFFFCLKWMYFVNHLFIHFKKDTMQQLPSEIQVIWSTPELIIRSRLIGVRPNNYSLAFSTTVRLHFACYSVCCPFSFYSVSFLGSATLFYMTGKWNWKQEKRSLENKADMTLYEKMCITQFCLLNNHIV